MKILETSICKLRLVALVISLLASGVWSVQAHAQRAAARYEIDAKRIGVSPIDKDALPRGREFVRLDSTYYVGWMYQGIYLHERSVDEAGYRRSLPMLRKAFMLMEKDFSGLLSSLYNSPEFYMQNNQRYNDYLVLGTKLREAYEYLEIPDSAFWVVTQIERKNFRRDFFGIAGAKSWIVHRNRFYTSAQYSFLKNSVEENEELALQYCYNGFARINRNMGMNNLWFGEGHDYADRQFIYHYLALLHCYLKNYDSSAWYYNNMASAGTVSWNNYGGMKTEIGEFAEAIDYFGKDRYKYGGIKALMEPYYYLPTLYVYAGKPKDAISTAREAITFSNSTPGFGWYQIAAARGYLYDGQLDSADLALNKAVSFKEIHIGTTLTQQQYDFTIGLLRLVWYNKKMAALRFADKGWWYRPYTLYQMSELQAKKYMHEYVLARQLAQNPERARLVYDLFCGESTVGFDEIYYLMERYSPGYFAGMMEDHAEKDPRERVKRYFELYEARLQLSKGQTKEATERLENLFNTVLLDTAHEKLFLGRLYESLALANEKRNIPAEADKYLNALYDTYPQLIPFSGTKPAMQLTVTGIEDNTTRQVYDQLKLCNMNWKTTPGDYPAAVVQFGKKGSKYEVVLQVTSTQNRRIVAGERFLFRSPEEAGAEIAMRLYAKGGAIEIEPPLQANNR